MPPSVSSQAAELEDAAHLASSLPEDPVAGHARAPRSLPRGGSPALSNARIARREHKLSRCALAAEPPAEHFMTCLQGWLPAYLDDLALLYCHECSYIFKSGLVLPV